jgi:hypothetical protein
VDTSDGAVPASIATGGANAKIDPNTDASVDADAEPII